MTVRINKQKINLREKLAGVEDKVNFDEVVRGLGEYTGNVGIGVEDPSHLLHIKSIGAGDFAIEGTQPRIWLKETDQTDLDILMRNHAGQFRVDVTQDNGNLVSTPFLINNTNGNVGIGTTNPAQKLDVYGNIAVNGITVHTSDDRVKHNEQPIVDALETLSKITPKKYIKTIEMYDANHDFELDADGNPIDENGEPVEHRVEAGVIAQQVLTVDELAFAVSPEGVDENGNVTSPHGLDYNSLFTYAIAAIQEQQQLIDDLKSRIETLEQQ